MFSTYWSCLVLFPGSISLWFFLKQYSGGWLFPTAFIACLALTIEMYKLRNNLSLNFITCLFPRKEYSYNMRNCQDFIRPNPKTVHWGTESLINLGPMIWDIIPTNIKSLPTLKSFIQSIKQWDPKHCPCRLCKIYIRDLGFLWSCDMYFCYLYFYYFILTFHVMFLLCQPK